MSGTASPLTTVWLARHGEVHNPAELLYGRLPRMRLSPEGQRQARKLAEFLAPRPLAAIYSSPLLRARRTAAAILERQPGLGRVRIDADLIEVRTRWQGEPLQALVIWERDPYIAMLASQSLGFVGYHEVTRFGDYVIYEP